MKDGFGREIEYLRVSVTQRCNLNCVYCGKTDCEKKGSELSPDSIGKLVGAFAKCGIKKVRVTGGEPLVRNDVCEIVERIRGVDAIGTVALTTNGVYLEKYAADLKTAGLDSVNISLDSTDGGTYRHLTGADVLERVMAGIEKAQSVGLSPLKVNAVLMKGVNSDGAGALVDLARKKDIDVRFIELMPFSDSGIDKSLIVTGADILAQFPFLKPTGQFEGTAEYYAADSFRGRVGLINPITKKFCSACNRIRLLSDGRVKPCLGHDETYGLTQYLNDEDRLEEEIRKIILKKPAGHSFDTQTPSYGLNRTGG
ncbi:MAG: GTP 3',8-cyclase MoaA [Clostridiales bacterium]|nr:GTP 3',8-cyclase MoaA [Clostridiales bacterium]